MTASYADEVMQAARANPVYGSQQIEIAKPEAPEPKKKEQQPKPAVVANVTKQAPAIRCVKCGTLQTYVDPKSKKQVWRKSRDPATKGRPMCQKCYIQSYRTDRKPKPAAAARPTEQKQTSSILAQIFSLQRRLLGEHQGKILSEYQDLKRKERTLISKAEAITACLQ